MAEELVSYHALFHDLFMRSEQRQWSEFYLRGQLSRIDRQTVEPMVLALRGPDAAAIRAGEYINALLPDAHGHQLKAIFDFVLALIDFQH